MPEAQQLFQYGHIIFEQEDNFFSQMSFDPRFLFFTRQQLCQSSQDFAVFDCFDNWNAIGHVFFDRPPCPCFDHLGIDIPIVFGKEPNIVDITHGKQLSLRESRELACKEVFFLAREHRDAEIFFYFVALPYIRYKDPRIHFNFDIVVSIAVGEQEENSISFYVCISHLSVFSEHPTDFFVHEFLCRFIGCEKVKVQIYGKTRQAIEKVGTRAAFESDERRDRGVGVDISKNLPHYKLVSFFIEHLFGRQLLALSTAYYHISLQVQNRVPSS